MQAAGRKMGVHLAILREWAGKMKTPDLSQAQDRILGKAHALWDPNRLWQNHHEEPPTRSGLGFHSLFEITTLAMTPMHWGKPIQQGAQQRN